MLSLYADARVQHQLKHTAYTCRAPAIVCKVRHLALRQMSVCLQACILCLEPCAAPGCCLPCSAPCVHLPSPARCQKPLPCGHQCPSLASEPCPRIKFCQTCASQKVKEQVGAHLMLAHTIALHKQHQP